VKISQPVVRGPLMIIIPVTFPGWEKEWICDSQTTHWKLLLSLGVVSCLATEKQNKAPVVLWVCTSLNSENISKMTGLKTVPPNIDAFLQRS